MADGVRKSAYEDQISFGAERASIEITVVHGHPLTKYYESYE